MYLSSKLGVGTPPVQNWFQPVIVDLSGGCFRNQWSSSSGTQITITGASNQSPYGDVGSEVFANTYDQNLNTLWNIAQPAVGTYTFNVTYSWASATISKIRISVGDNGIRIFSRILIYSDSGRTTTIFDSGILTGSNYFANGPAYSYDCVLATPITCTQLWFSLTNNNTYQPFVNEVQPFAISGPEYITYDSAATTSNRAWSEVYSLSNAYWRLMNDSGSIASNWLAVTRNNLTTSAIRFSTGTTSNIERFTILSNGNVGVGTSNPAYTFDISGSLRTYTMLTTGGGLVLNTSSAGSVPNGNANTWNETLYFTGIGRAWGVGVETTAAANYSLGFFDYTAASGGPISGTRYIRGYVLGANAANNTAFNFTGQHRCFIKDFSVEDISSSVGLVVCATENNTINMSGGLKRGKDAITISESLPIVTLASNAYDKRVFGVIALVEDPERREDAFGSFVTPLEKQPGDTRAYINSLGEGAIWVANTGGNIYSGDYVCTSSIPGYAQKQNDDLLHSYTVAKITMDCDFTAPLQPKYDILRDICGNNILDAKGNITWIPMMDASGDPVLEAAYDLRILDTSGTVAAFLPCTYHCG